jgi:hypothetical protein
VGLEDQAYNTFIETSPQGSLFHTTWWLDTVAGDRYDILFIKEKEEIVAAWPLTYNKLMGLHLITLPQLTPKLGIMLAPSSKIKYAEQLSKEINLIANLINLLPKHFLFYQRFSPEFTNWLPLYWANFKQTTRYTYVIENLSDLNKVWQNLRSNAKNHIRKAIENKLKVVTNLSLEKLLDLNQLTYNRQKLAVPYSREYVRRIDQACQKHGARKIFFAVDSEGSLHAAVYLVYDKKTAYYLLGGSNPELRSSGAQYLALWEAIKFAATVSQSFDFEGSMHSNIEPVFRGFGGVQKPYMEITRGNFFSEMAFSVLRRAWNKGGVSSAFCSRLLR